MVEILTDLIRNKNEAVKTLGHCESESRALSPPCIVSEQMSRFLIITIQNRWMLFSDVHGIN